MSNAELSERVPIGCWNCGGPQAGKIDEMAYDELVRERDAYREALEWIADGASGMYGVIRARQALDWTIG